jgi:2-oxoglutarate dehydrogenase E2 component (dihydrolipoamide succinyltransferase)
MVPAGCANDENPSAVHARDLGTQKGEILVPYEPVVSRKITQDPSQFPMPAAPAPATAPVAAEAPAAGGETPAPAAADATPPDMASLPPSPEGEQLAAALMDDLNNGKYKDIEARFGPELKTLIPPDALKMQWGQAAERLGQYQSIQTSAGRKVPKDGQTYDYAEAVLQFARGTAVLMVAFDSQKQIAQLSIVPGQARQRGTETEAPAPAAETPAAPAAAAETPAAAPARPARPAPTPARPAAPAPPSRSGSGSANMDMLPPTAPAPVGLGN